MADGPPELLETLHTRFQEDLAQVFGEKAKDFNESLVNLLFEFWSQAVHSEMRLIPDEQTLTKKVHHILVDTLTASTVNVGKDLQTLYENGENPFQDAVATMGMPDAYMMVPVLMHKGTGQVFGVDLPGRRKYVTTQRIVHLTSDVGGHTWRFDTSNQPPSRQDSNATHVIVRVDGVVKTAPTDYIVNTTRYGTDEAVESIYMMFPCPDAEVTATYPDVTTGYF